MLTNSSEVGRVAYDDPQRLMHAREAAAHLGVSRKTLMSWAASGKLPPPLRLGHRTVAWRRADVLAAPERIDRLTRGAA